MDPFHTREGEDELFTLINSPRAEDGGADDGSQFLNDSGPGMELEVQTSTECDDGSRNVGPSEVY
jgi:hypothetical protein